MIQEKKVRALGLISGGLDSMLAVCLLKEQGIEVTGITFVTPFFSAAKAETAARRIGFPLLVRDITIPHLALVKSPPSGYGSQMNPCIDCHALMLRVAGKIMDDEGYDILFTGEVLNERPMSQNLRSLNRVANLSGNKGRILRPLSALLLAETAPEQAGKVNRSRLLDVQGRSRRRQFELAERYGIRDYPTPAGGCLLTDPAFSKRLRDLFEYGPKSEPRNVEMLKVGRHFRLRKGVKAVIGRNADDNRTLAGLAGNEDLVFRTLKVPGPIAILSGSRVEDDIYLTARLCARYSDHRSLSVQITISDGISCRELDVKPMAEVDICPLRL